jgi:hypothetical protein
VIRQEIAGAILARKRADFAQFILLSMKKLCYRIPGAHVARIAPAGAIPPATKKTSCKRTSMPEKG